MKERGRTFAARTPLLAMAGILAVLLGGAIYVLCRSTSLLMFSWFYSLGLSRSVAELRSTWGSTTAEFFPEVFVLSAPFALWVLAYILLIESVWGKGRSWQKSLWKWSLPLVATASELAQCLGLLRGTFDTADLAALLGAILVAALLTSVPTRQRRQSMPWRPRALASACLAALTCLLVAGSEQRSSRSTESRPTPADSPSQGEESDGSAAQQGNQAGSAAAAQQGQAGQGQSGSAAGATQANSGQNAGSQQAQQGAGQMQGNAQQQQSGANSGAQQGQAPPPPSQPSQGTTSGLQAGPPGSSSGAGGSSPFATNASRGVPQVDPVTGGYVVTPGAETAPPGGDAQQAPGKKPFNYPEFR